MIIFLVFIIVLSSLVSASEVENDFNDEPTAENFQNLPIEKQNSENLLKVENPTLDNFKVLNEGEKTNYLKNTINSKYNNDFAQEYIKNINFEGSDKETQGLIAQKFFTYDVLNVNQNKDQFGVFYKNHYNVNIKLDGSLLSYTKEGEVSTNQGNPITKINIIKFKDRYNFKVDNSGNLILVDKSGDNEYKVSGVVTQSQNQNLEVLDGYIDGKKIINGQNIILSGDVVSGKFLEFDGVIFQEGSDLMYDYNTNLLTLYGGEIKTIKEFVDLNIKGSAKINPENYDVIKGNLKVDISDRFILNNFAIENSMGRKPIINLPVASELKRGNRGEDVEKLQEMLVFEGYLPSDENDGIFGPKTENALKKWQDENSLVSNGIYSSVVKDVYEEKMFKQLNKNIMPIELKFAENKKNSDDDEKNFVRFSDTVTINGNNFRFGFTPNQILDKSKEADNSLQNILPEKGYYENGDKYTNSEELDNIRTIQRIVGTNDDGHFGPATKLAVEKWQAENNLPITGRFNQLCIDTYLKNVGESLIYFEPEGAKIVLDSNKEKLGIDIQGNSKIIIDGEQLETNSKDITREIGYNLLKTVRYPVDIKLLDNEGNDLAQFQQTYKQFIKPEKILNLGGKSLGLKLNQVYIVAAGQTAFTEAVSPDQKAKILESMSPELKEQIAKAGHMGLMWVDETGQPFVIESSWEGVVLKKIDESHMGKVRESITGVYELTDKSGIDHLKVIREAQLDDERNIGWFFSNVENSLGTFGLNRVLNKDYESYRNCVGEVTSLLERGGFSDVTDNAQYIPMKEVDEKTIEALTKYINSFTGGKGEVTGNDVANMISEEMGDGKISQGLQYLAQRFLGDKVVSDIAGSALGKSFELINKYEGYKDKLGMNPSEFVTPSQLIYGNLEKGVIAPAREISSEQYVETGKIILDGLGYSGKSAIEDFQSDYNMNCEKTDSCTPIKVDNQWGTSTWVALYSQCANNVLTC
jgi:peptidoglycan hydrolase-like protein with peptidoglycan-binding domain